MKLSARFLLVFIVMFSLFRVGTVKASAAARLYLDPSSATKNIGDTFTVTAKVDSGGEVIGGVDGIGTYDSSRLELSSITQASDMVFSSVDGGGSCTSKISDGKFSFSCNANSAVGSQSVSGSLVVFTFKAKATGTALVKFTCVDGSTVDSNIVKASTASDVITCSSNGSGSYTINEGSSSSSTTTTTTTSTATSTPTSTSSTTTELPQTGSVGVTVGLIVFGLVSLLSAVFLKFL